MRHLIEHGDLTAQGLIRDLGHSVTPNSVFVGKCVAKVTFKGAQKVCVFSCILYVQSRERQADGVAACLARISIRLLAHRIKADTLTLHNAVTSI